MFQVKQKYVRLQQLPFYCSQAYECELSTQVLYKCLCVFPQEGFSMVWPEFSEYVSPNSSLDVTVFQKKIVVEARRLCLAFCLDHSMSTLFSYIFLNYFFYISLEINSPEMKAPLLLSTTLKSNRDWENILRFTLCQYPLITFSSLALDLASLHSVKSFREPD